MIDGVTVDVKAGVKVGVLHQLSSHQPTTMRRGVGGLALIACEGGFSTARLLVAHEGRILSTSSTCRTGGGRGCKRIGGRGEVGEAECERVGRRGWVSEGVDVTTVDVRWWVLVDV